MKNFVVIYNPYDFFGKTKYHEFNVRAKNCLHAVAQLFMSIQDGNRLDIIGVKPSGAIRWRKDNGLRNPERIVKAALAEGHIMKKDA